MLHTEPRDLDHVSARVCAPNKENQELRPLLLQWIGRNQKVSIKLGLLSRDLLRHSATLLLCSADDNIPAAEAVEHLEPLAATNGYATPVTEHKVRQVKGLIFCHKFERNIGI